MKKELALDTTNSNKQIERKDFITEYKNKFKSKKYKVKIEKDCDLNMDGQIDKIFVFEPLEITNNKLIKNSLVCILINKKLSYNIHENKNIIYTLFFNSMAEGFQDLVVKNNYFTIEENNQAGNIRKNDYITFKYDFKYDEILLYKYGIEFISVDGENDKTLSYDKISWGKIFFKDFDTLKEKLIK